MSSQATTLSLHQVFTSADDFKAAVRATALSQHWEVGVYRSNKKRVIMNCRLKKDCPFEIRCSYGDGVWRVISLKENHTCLGAPNPSRAEASRLQFLVQEIPKLLNIKLNPTGAQVQSAMKLHHGQEVSLRQAQRALQQLRHLHHSNHREDYAKIPDYLTRLTVLHMTNGIVLDENNRIIDGTEPHFHTMYDADKRLTRIFIGPPHASTVWMFSFPFLSLDGTFLKSCFGQTLLTATCRDSNNEIYPLAWAIVESENKESWSWFLQQLKAGIPGLYITRDATLISDRDKGLQAADSELDSFTRAWCVWHIQQNIKNRVGGQNGELSSKLFGTLAHASDETKYDQILNEISKVSSEATAYINGIPRELWCLAFFPGRRFGHITSGISEAFNSLIAEDRELTVLELLDALWNRLAELRATRQLKAEKLHQSGQVFTPYAMKLLRESINQSWRYTAKITAQEPPGNFLEARVLTTSSSRVRIVRFSKNFMGGTYKCDCRQFNDQLFPCSHAASALQRAGRDVTDAIHDIYRISNLQTAYAKPLHTISLDDIEPAPEILAPPARRRAGRPQKKRKEKGDRYGYPAKDPRCSRCNAQGHNIRTCPNNSNDIYTLWKPDLLADQPIFISKD